MLRVPRGGPAAAGAWKLPLWLPKICRELVSRGGLGGVRRWGTLLCMAWQRGGSLCGDYRSAVAFSGSKKGEGRQRSASSCLSDSSSASCHLCWSSLAQLKPRGLLFASSACCSELKTCGKLQGGRSPCSDLQSALQSSRQQTLAWEGAGTIVLSAGDTEGLGSPHKRSRTLLSGSRGPPLGPMGTVCRGCHQWGHCSRALRSL